jgi:hypothetical protein
MVFCGYFDKCRFKIEQQLMQIVQLHSQSFSSNIAWETEHPCCFRKEIRVTHTECDVARMHDSDILKNPKHAVLCWCVRVRFHVQHETTLIADLPLRPAGPGDGNRDAGASSTVTVARFHRVPDLTPSASAGPGRAVPGRAGAAVPGRNSGSWAQRAFTGTVNGFGPVEPAHWQAGSSPSHWQRGGRPLSGY